MEKIYLVELKILKENALYGLQEIILISPKLLYLKCHRE